MAAKAATCCQKRESSRYEICLSSGTGIPASLLQLVGLGVSKNLINWEPSIHHVWKRVLRSPSGDVYTFRLYAKLVVTYQL